MNIGWPFGKAKIVAQTVINGGIHPDDREYYGGRRITQGEIDDTFASFNDLPPRQTRFCKRCSEEVRWFREGAQFSSRTGRPGHSYHLKCPHYGNIFYEVAKGQYEDMPPGPRASLRVNDADSHYNSHLYRFLERDEPSLGNDEVS